MPTTVTRRNVGRSLLTPANAKVAVQIGKSVGEYLRSDPKRQKTAAHPAGVSAVTTDHHDVSLVFKGRRRRRYNKKQAQFTRRVRKILQGSPPSQFLAVSLPATHTIPSNGQASSGLATLFGMRGDAWNDDIPRLFAQLPDAERLKVTGAQMELVLNNAGATTIYIDCYYWRCKRSVPWDSTKYGTGISQFVQNGFTQLVTNIPTGGSAMDLVDYGVTPFQSPYWTQHIRTIKKVRIKLGAGESTQLKMGVKLNRVFNKQTANNFLFAAGCTQGIFTVAYGVPSTGNLSTSGTIHSAVSKNITFKRLEITRPTAGHDTT